MERGQSSEKEVENISALRRVLEPKPGDVVAITRVTIFLSNQPALWGTGTESQLR